MSLPCSSSWLSASEPRPPSGQRPPANKPPEHPRLWAAVCLGGGQGFGAKYCVRVVRFSVGTRAGELQVLLVLFLLPCSHPVLARPVFRPMQEQPGLSVAAGPFAKVRLLQPGDDVSSLLFLCFFATMPRSRPAHTLFFPLHLTNATIAGATGCWLAGRGTLKARHLSRVGGKVNDV